MRKRQREVMQRYYTLVRMDTRRAATSQPSASSSGDSIEDNDDDTTGCVTICHSIGCYRSYRYRRMLQM